MTSDERRKERYKRRKAKRDERKIILNKMYGDYDKASSFKELKKAFYESRKGVSWKASVQKYEKDLMKNTLKLHETLKNGKNFSKGFYEFDIFERGKERHIKSVHITERCVQKSFSNNCFVPMLSNSFIYDNGASLKGKGTQMALKRAEKHLHDFYRKNGNKGVVITGDYSKFFDSLHHGPILDTVREKFIDERFYTITKYLIDPYGNVGLGLGSQINQIFAVGYPNKIDQYIKTVKGVKGYGRYMDDFYVLTESNEKANEILEGIKRISDQLGLKLNEKKTQKVKISKGFTFLKTRLFLTDTGKVVKKMCRENITRRRRTLKAFKKKLDAKEMTYEQIRCSYNSWRGYAKKKDAYKTIRNMDKLFNKLFIEEWITT